MNGLLRASSTAERPIRRDGADTPLTTTAYVSMREWTPEGVKPGGTAGVMIKSSCPCRNDCFFAGTGAFCCSLSGTGNALRGGTESPRRDFYFLKIPFPAKR